MAMFPPASVPVTAAPLGTVPVKQVRAGGQVLKVAASYWQPLYDIRTPAAGTAFRTQEFFQQGHTAGRSWELTNVPTAGKLPGGVVYSVHGYAIKVLPETVANPLNLVDFRNFQQGLMTFYIGDRAALRMPLSVLGGMGGVAAATGSDTSFVNNGPFSVNDYWRNPAKEYDEPIVSEQNFRVVLSWTAAWTPAAALRIQCFLIGDWHTIIDRN